MIFGGNLFQVISSDNQRAWLKECEYVLCRSVNQLFDYLSTDKVVAARAVGADFESDRKNVEKANPVCATFSLESKKALYYPVGHKIGAELNLPSGPLIEALQTIDSLPDVVSVWHNYKYDGELTLHKYGFLLKNFRDSMIANYLENPNHNVYGLKEVIRRLYGIEPIEFEQVAGQRSFDLVHPDEGIPYACQDADFARRIYLHPSVQVALKEQEFISRLEHMCVEEVRQGEMNKVYLSLPALQEIRADVDRRVTPLLSQIYELAGGEFLVDSPVKLGAKLVQLGIPFSAKDKTVKTGQPSTRKETLEKYANFHPIIPLVIQYKELTTQMRNYVDKMIGAVQHFGCAVRFPFHQIGVPTGRMKAGGEGDIEEAYEKGVMPINVQSLPDHEKKPYLPNIRASIVANPPPLQDIPLETIMGAHIASKFRGQGDFVIVAADYSQVELRIAANMSRESAWIKTFSEGGDIHLKNAQLAYRDYKMISEDPRRKRGKTISFAILYGGSAYTVAQHGNIPVEHGQVLVDNFFAGAPALKKWIDSWIKMARQQHFVKTYFGRKRPLDEYYNKEAPNWLKNKGDREAVNDPIQGGAADVFKLGMIKLGKMIRANNWQQDVMQTLWIHDEFVLRVRRSMLEQIVPEIIKALEFEVKNWPVSLKTEVEIGWNWGEMIPWETYKVLGVRGLDLVPWKKYTDKYKELGVSILNEVDEEGAVVEEDSESTDTPSLNRADYGF